MDHLGYCGRHNKYRVSSTYLVFLCVVARDDMLSLIVLMIVTLASLGHRKTSASTASRKKKLLTSALMCSLCDHLGPLGQFLKSKAIWALVAVFAKAHNRDDTGYRERGKVG
jgi:hypothetical protein